MVRARHLASVTAFVLGALSVASAAHAEVPKPYADNVYKVGTQTVAFNKRATKVYLAASNERARIIPRRSYAKALLIAGRQRIGRLIGRIGLERLGKRVAGESERSVVTHTYPALRSNRPTGYLGSLRKVWNEGYRSTLRVADGTITPLQTERISARGTEFDHHNTTTTFQHGRDRSVQREETVESYGYQIMYDNETVTTRDRMGRILGQSSRDRRDGGQPRER